MKRTLLDTDIFSEILKRKHPQVIAIAQQYRHEMGVYTLSTITVLEIVKGLHKVGRESAIRQVLTTIDTEEMLTLTTASAILGGRIYADLERAGAPIGRVDPMIAAIALHHGLTLATGNVRHYQRIQALGYALELTNWKDSDAVISAP